jgi:hypothetical protein
MLNVRGEFFLKNYVYNYTLTILSIFLSTHIEAFTSYTTAMPSYQQYTNHMASSENSFQEAQYTPAFEQTDYSPIDTEAYHQQMTSETNCNSETTELLSPTTKPAKPKAKNVCNGEIGPALNFSMRKTLIKFRNLSWWQRRKTCSNPWNYATKFDFIFPSFALPCGTGTCSRCVQVNGFRRFDGDINYAFMGMMMKLCGVHRLDAEALVVGWKGVMYLRQVPDAVWYWFDAGWDFPDPRSSGNLTDVTKRRIPPNRDDKSFLHCLNCNKKAKYNSFDSPMWRIWGNYQKKKKKVTPKRRSRHSPKIRRYSVK